MTNRESDDRIVATKPGNSGGGKAVKPSRESSRTPFTLSGEPTVTSRLDRITNRAELHPTKTFTNLFTLINVEAHLIRYADDFICTFELEDDARRFQAVLAKRLGRSSLELAPDKTKLIRFGRFADRDAKRLSEGTPELFDFLGFTHYCGHSRAGTFKLKRRTSKKKYRAKIADIKSWFRSKLTTPIIEVWATLRSKLQGHYQYYGINDNWPWLLKYFRTLRRLSFRWMRRRSQTGDNLSWTDFHLYEARHSLPLPRKLTDLIAMYG